MDNGNGTGTGPAPTGPLTVKEAAAHLGIGERAVRKRIHAGTLMAQHIDRIWRVWPDAQSAGGTNGATEQGCSTMELRNKAAEQGPALPAATAIMESIVAPIAAELAAARQTIERLARENGALTERIRALEAADYGRDTAASQAAEMDARDEMDRARFGFQESGNAASDYETRYRNATEALDQTLTAQEHKSEEHGDLWAQLAAKAAAVPDAVTQAFEVLEAAQPDDPPRRGLLARLFRRRGAG